MGGNRAYVARPRMNNRGNIRHFAPIALPIAVVGAFLRALPYLGATPDETLLISAVRGLAAQKHFADFNPATVHDHLCAWMWQAGGATALSWGQWTLTFLGWAVAFFAVLLALKALLELLPDRRVRGILFATTLILIFAVCLPTAWDGIFQRSRKISNLALVAPVSLCEKAKAASGVFPSPSALPYLVLFAPQFAGKVPPAESVALSKDPGAWRSAQRKSHWDAVLLSGRADEYKPLLDHLISSPDWRLAAVDNFGYLFVAGSGPAVALPNFQTFKLGSDQETAIYLAEVAGYLDGIRKTNDARMCIERALELAPQNLTVLAHAATFFAERKRWQDAISYCDRALQINPDHAHAKIVKALALVELKEPQKAYNILNEVLIQMPDDVYTLFLQARVSRSLHDYASESRLLEKLLRLPGRTDEATAYYHLYLGQAYAKQGFADPALQHYRVALDSGHLSPEQVTDVKDQIKTIEAKKFP